MSGTQSNHGTWPNDPTDHKTQDKLYRLTDKLKSMAREIPPKYQPRLSYELLSSLAALLLDETVLKIVDELMELQYMTERHFHEIRCSILAKHRAEKDRMRKLQKEEVDIARSRARLHALPQMQAQHLRDVQEMERRQTAEIQKCNADCLHSIDQKVMEQQSVLEQVGVPGFYVTTNPIDVKVQMFIIGFIMNIGKSRHSYS